MSLNKVMLIGNVGAGVDVRTTDGRRWAKTTLATTDRAYTTRDGVKVPERTEWHNLVFYGQLVSIVETWVTKGTKLFVEGKLRTRKYQKNGQDHWITEIEVYNMELLGGNRPGDNNQQQPY